jgi:hypothetical protein
MGWLRGNISSILKRNDQAWARRLNLPQTRRIAARFCHFTPAILAHSSHDNPWILSKISHEAIYAKQDSPTAPFRKT